MYNIFIFGVYYFSFNTIIKFKTELGVLGLICPVSVFMDSMPKEPEEWAWRMLLSEPEESCLQNRQDRFFADRIMRNWARKAPERVFRNRRNDQNFADETKLSHAPCAVDEEGVSVNRRIRDEKSE